MKDLEGHYPIGALCAAFGVTRSGYHAWKVRPSSARANTDAQLSQHLCQIHADSRQTYGSPRLLQALQKKGLRTSRRRVCRLMREHQLRGAARVPTADHRQPAAGCLLHSDRGSQYASAAYRARVVQAGLVMSMSRTGNCYDNAAMESFWGKLKTELIHRRKFTSPDEARSVIFEHVEVFCNRRRLHSAPGFQSPVDFENQTN